MYSAYCWANNMDIHVSDIKSLHGTSWRSSFVKMVSILGLPIIGWIFHHLCTRRLQCGTGILFFSLCSQHTAKVNRTRSAVAKRQLITKSESAESLLNDLAHYSSTLYNNSRTDIKAQQQDATTSYLAGKWQGSQLLRCSQLKPLIWSHTLHKHWCCGLKSDKHFFSLWSIQLQISNADTSFCN